MKKPALLSCVPIFCALLAAGCATGNPAANAFGNWVGAMMVAEAGRPQVTVNNAGNGRQGTLEERVLREAKEQGDAINAARARVQGPPGGKQGSVTIYSNLNDNRARIHVDGFYVGNAPTRLKLSQGTHVIDVRQVGFKPFQKEIIVTGGSELNLLAELQKP